MSEVVTVASLRVRDGHEAEAEAALREVARATHEEEGCLLYALHRALDDPARFVLIERWRSREDLDAHLQSPHVQRLASSADLLDGPVHTWFAEALAEGDPRKGALR